MLDKTCKALTKAGTRCKMKPLASGYCHIHDLEVIAKREAERKRDEDEWKRKQQKGEKLREVLGAVEAACKAKGWQFQVETRDCEDGRYATVSVRRFILAVGVDEGIFEITINGGIDIIGEQTCGSRPRFESLRDAILVA